jgi:xanthine dehydrogenase accessory factor
MMREILDDLDRWRAAGLSVVMAKVIDIDGSAPRLPGAAMAVNESGEVAGSVSGGCVEGAVVTEALEVMESGEPRLVSFGYSDDEAFAVGLTCGGNVHLFLEPWRFDETHARLRARIRTHRPIAVATVVEGPNLGRRLLVEPDESEGSLGDRDLDRVVARDARGALASGATEVRHYGAHGEAREAVVTVAVDSFVATPRMLVFGAVDFTRALVRAAKVLGYHVTVCDAREVFATPQRFPEADAVVVDWPHRLLERIGHELGPRDAICVLTHDHKFDVPGVIAALRTEVGYIGAMGSRRTHDERCDRLRAEGVTDVEIRRVMSPIGLDLGARTPDETAIAICAEIIATRTGRPVPSLRDRDGPIH